jgi:hypothetical protein
MLLCVNVKNITTNYAWNTGIAYNSTTRNMWTMEQLRIYPTNSSDGLYLRHWFQTYVARTEVVNERLKMLRVKSH